MRALVNIPSAAYQTREQSGAAGSDSGANVAKRKTGSADDGASLFEEPLAVTEPEPAEPEIDPKLLPANFPASWTRAIGAEFAKLYFAELRQFIVDERKASDILPPGPDVFNAFRATPLDRVRVVILGQDPYPTPGHAHGLCFSVRPGVRLPGSLRNIYRELESDLGLPPAKHGYLESWAERGVLLLNAVLTVRAGVPNSHKGKGWETFTDAVIRAVNNKPDPVVFVLWGAYAQKKIKLIDTDRHTIVQSAHPSPLSAANGFFGSRPFSKINEALKKNGVEPIDWDLSK